MGSPQNDRSSTPETSRLRTGHVLFVDIVGYSLLATDEQIRSVHQLQSIVRELPGFRETLAAKELICIPTGDGMAIVCFSEADAPVRFARDIAIRIRQESPFDLRMGLHNGPVYCSDDINANRNVAGGGINLAQRIMDCGDAGHILISQSVADILLQLSHWRGAVRDLGECEVKHGSRVRIFNLSTSEFGNTALPSRLRAAGNGLPVDGMASIAVLPFINAGQAADLDYLCDGITESLINNLSEIPKLRVVPRSTVFRYKAAEIDLERATRELNARTLLTGKVFQRNETLNVQAELVDTAAGAQLWGQKYNRRLTDIAVVEEEIAREIVNALRVKLNSHETARFGQRSTDSAEAYQLFLKGRYLWNKRTRESLERAIEYFRHAIDQDPTYARAYAGLADSYSVLGTFGFRRPMDVFPLARAAAQHAIDIDEGLAEPHVTLALASSFFEVDHTAAEGEYQRALKLNPNYAVGHQGYGAHLCFMGDFQQGLRELQQAQRLEPLSPMINVQLGVGFYLARQYEEAARILVNTIQFEPAFWPAHHFLGTVYAQQGDAKAKAEFEIAAELSQRHPLALSGLGRILAREGQLERAGEILEELGTRARSEYVSAVHFAAIHLELGDKDLALQRLQEGVAEHSSYAVWLNVEPASTLFGLMRASQP